MNSPEIFFENADAEVTFVDEDTNPFTCTNEFFSEENYFLQNEAYVGIPVPKVQVDKVPSTLMVVRKIGDQESKRVLRVLFDSGGSHTMINKNVMKYSVI